MQNYKNLLKMLIFFIKKMYNYNVLYYKENMRWFEYVLNWG